MARRPGWYADPADRTRLRRWNGAEWDYPSRRLPPWASGTVPFVVDPQRNDGPPYLEGPARRAVLTANVTSGSGPTVALPPHAGPGPTGHRSHGMGSVRAPAPGWIGVPTSRPRWPAHVPFFVACALVVVALLAFAGTIGIGGRSAVQSDQTGADATFVRAANVACASRLGTARSPGRPAAVLTPTEASHANTALHALVAKLRSLPAVAATNAPLQDWFDDWEQYAGDRAHLAAFAAAHSSPDQAAKATEQGLIDSTSQAAAQADSFAMGSSLHDCKLTGPTGPTAFP
jgi:hypothetical protein